MAGGGSRDGGICGLIVTEMAVVGVCGRESGLLFIKWTLEKTDFYYWLVNPMKR